MLDQTNPTPPQADAWTPRRVAVATLVVLAIVGAFFILFRFRLVFFSLFTAIVLSTALKPAVDKLTGWGLPRPLSVTLISLILLVLVVVLLITTAPMIVEQWATITALIGDWYSDLRRALIGSESLLIRRIARQLPLFLPLTWPVAAAETGDAPATDMIEQAFVIGRLVIQNLLVIITVGILTIFWVLEGDRAIRFVLMAVPTQHRESTREFITEVENKVGAYTRGLVVLCTIIGLMALVSYMIIGLPNVLLLAILAGIMEAVPLVGPLLGAIPAVAVAASTDPSKVIWVIVATAIFQALENNLIVPRVMNRAVGVSPVAGLLAFIAFGTIFGFVGALLAIPLAAVIQLTLSRFLFRSNPIEQSPLSGRDAISTLRYETQDLMVDVRKQIRQKDTELDEGTDQIEESMEAIAQDLDSVLAQLENKGRTNGSASVRQMP
jgi:predicted PurR-regulated permease PerM